MLPHQNRVQALLGLPVPRSDTVIDVPTLCVLGILDNSYQFPRPCLLVGVVAIVDRVSIHQTWGANARNSPIRTNCRFRCWAIVLSGMFGPIHNRGHCDGLY